jgi:fatty acid desaturase
MSIIGSWIATLAFLFVLFLVGLYLQHKEKQDKLTRRASEAIRHEMTAAAASVGAPPVFGTLYGNLTQHERRTRER